MPSLGIEEACRDPRSDANYDLPSDRSPTAATCATTATPSPVNEYAANALVITNLAMAIVITRARSVFFAPKGTPTVVGPAHGYPVVLPGPMVNDVSARERFG